MNRFACPVALALILATATVTLPAQARLQIVVIEGEDAVNVIEQKTAVAPIVEVRDSNNQPVAGVLVKFAVTKGKASFSGAKAVSVATNAAGRANAAGFTPTGTGSLQVTATASYQGVTATATIAQTTLATAAAAAGAGAGAGAAAAGAGAAGAGGGISATTIAIIGGAAVGGVVGTKAIINKAQGGGTKYSGHVGGNLVETMNVTGQPPCTFTYTTDATLILHMDVNGTGVSGTAEINGTQGPTSSTCPNSGGFGAPAGIPWEDSPISGTTSAISVQFTYTGVVPGPVGNHYTTAGMFVGALNGNTVTGNLVWTWTDTAPTLNGFGTATIPVTATEN